MDTSVSFFSLCDFISKYAARLMSAGVHTSRIIRNTSRIGQCFGVDVQMSAFYKSIMITISKKGTTQIFNKVINIPHHYISFEHNSELSALSWEAYDEHLTFREVRDKYERIISAPRIHPLFVLMMVGLANASFCRLFDGDFISMAIVFSSTLIGMFLKQQMVKKQMNPYVIFVISSFVASICSSTSLIFQTTAETCIATSVLYLIPGVPLINGVIDIVEGHVLTGFARLVEATLLIICIAVGLSITLMLIKDRLL
jgi:uncharacterized membrane protein YjjP (DUF1212 family)